VESAAALDDGDAYRGRLGLRNAQKERGSSCVRDSFRAIVPNQGGLREVCGPNEAIGFMSMVDGAARSSTARVKEPVELSIIDQRKFRFMVDEVPNFALYIMGAMARRIRGMGQAM